MKKKIIIVGAGASGMMAAVMAARSGAEVLILEQKEAPGKKILATGNGHCNFTNKVMNAACYHGNDWVMEKLETFGVEETLSFFEELGIYPEEKNGYYYPASEQASAVVELFCEELKRLGIKVITEAQVKKILPLEQGFDVEYIKTERNQVRMSGQMGKKAKGKSKAADSFKTEIRTERCHASCDRVILSCGGKASPKLGSDGSGYYLAGLLGHNLVEPLPALTGIQCRENWFKRLAGIRISAEINVKIDGDIKQVSASAVHKAREARLSTEGEEKAPFEGDKTAVAEFSTEPDGQIYTCSSSGELQLADYGISGIPVFQISGPVARALSKGACPQIFLTFHPEIGEEAYKAYLETHSESQYAGLFPKALIEVMKEVNGSLETRTLSCKPLSVNDFDRAQVTTGGIPISEIDHETLESLCCPGVFLTGELLDVDGICGGYNLQWAWTSGAIAGQCAAK